MNRTTLLWRIARRLAERSGSDERIDELTDHFDELEANGQSLSPLDVGSIAILAVRSPLRVAARSFVRTYASILLVGIATWWTAVWTGLLGSLETTMEATLSLEDFQFIGTAILVAFAAAALPLSVVIIATKVIFRQPGMRSDKNQRFSEAGTSISLHIADDSGDNGP